MYARRLLLNLALLAVVAALAAFILFPRPKPAPGGVAVAPDVNPAAVHHIRIERSGRPPLVFERKSGSWRLTAPISAQANPLLMQALLELPRERSHTRYAAGGLHLARYGLTPPRASIYFGATRIGLGNINPLNQLRYVVSGGGLFLVADHLAGLPESPAINWISLSLLPPKAHIVRLRLPTLDIRATQPAGWTLRPTPPSFSTAQVTALLSAWRHTAALQLTAAPGAPAVTQGEIHIALADGTRQRLQIVATTPELILRNPALGLDYHLPAGAARRLLHLPGVPDRNKAPSH